MLFGQRRDFGIGRCRPERLLADPEHLIHGVHQHAGDAVVVAVQDDDPAAARAFAGGQTEAHAQVDHLDHLAANPHDTKDALPRLRELLSAPGGDPEIRAAAARGLLGIGRGTAIGPVARVLADPSTPDALREQVGVALSEQDDPAARRAVVAALRTVPFRVQQRWALALTASRDGADAFLGAIESGAAAPRLLQLPGARDRLRAAAPPDWGSRLGPLTPGLPPASEERDRLLADRTAGFSTARPDPAAGREIYRQNCAACHQLDGEGALVGPQLTGIGNRGVERLCEDILDPNRNVDAAFRQSLLTLDDGEILSGLFRREEGEVVVLANAAGQEFSVPRSRVRSRVEIEQSLMPDNFGESLAPADFNHLLAYLLGRR